MVNFSSQGVKLILEIFYNSQIYIRLLFYTLRENYKLHKTVWKIRLDEKSVCLWCITILQDVYLHETVNNKSSFNSGPNCSNSFREKVTNIPESWCILTLKDLQTRLKKPTYTELYVV